MFKNNVPIDEELAILDLLCPRWGDCTTRELNDHHVQHGPYVEIYHCHDHSDPEVVRFRIAKGAPAVLLRRGYVRGTVHWGWVDDKLLRITDKGRNYFWDEVERLKLSEELVAERWYW